MASKCCIKRFGGCCCNCRWRYVDRSHPGTDGKSSMLTRGYICAEPFLGYHSGWSEHGMCEEWAMRPERPNPPMDDYTDIKWGQAEAWDACYEERDDNADLSRNMMWETLRKNWD